MAAPARAERRADLVTDSSAKATTRQQHDSSCLTISRPMTHGGRPAAKGFGESRRRADPKGRGFDSLRPRCRPRRLSIALLSARVASTAGVVGGHDAVERWGCCRLSYGSLAKEWGAEKRLALRRGGAGLAPLLKPHEGVASWREVACDTGGRPRQHVNAMRADPEQVAPTPGPSRLADALVRQRLPARPGALRTVQNR